MAVTDYLCFTAEQAGSTVNYRKINTLAVEWTGEYSTDGANWTSYTLDTIITLANAGDKVYFRGTLSGAQEVDKYHYFAMTGKIAASGNVMSLNYKDDFATRDTIEHARAFVSLFSGCTSLTTPPELPATTLTRSCYLYMFYGCSNLNTLPELPATKLSDECYYCMFMGCSNIKLSKTQTGDYNAPFRIPTTGTGTVGSNSLIWMFAYTGGTFADTPTINTTYYYPKKLDPVPNKITYGNTILLDLTGDTVKPEYVRSGVTFHTADGQSAKGTSSTGASSTLSGTPGINKVVYNGKTLIDLTADTITPGDVTSGYTFHACDGNQYTGTA